jgi:hypothetical protein
MDIKLLFSIFRSLDILLNIYELLFSEILLLNGFEELITLELTSKAFG